MDVTLSTIDPPRKTCSLVKAPISNSFFQYKDNLIIHNGPHGQKHIPLNRKDASENMYIGERIGKKIQLKKKVETLLVPPLGDFLLPSFNSSYSFYSEMDALLLENDSHHSWTNYFNNYIKDHEEIPYFPIPTLSLTGVFKQYNFKEFKASKKKTNLLIKIKLEETPPKEPNSEIEKKIKIKLGESYSSLKTIFSSLFSTHPIWSIKQIEKEVLTMYPEILKKLKWSIIKTILPLLAYTYSTGPWKKLWIKYNYNPTQDPSAYIYQVYVWKNITKAFMIRENKDILKRISATPEYTTKKFHRIRGFLTEKALEYLHNTLSEVNVPQQKASSTHLLDTLHFETLD
ncbi:hypothetical protein NEFER03_1767 [Nematocida sp. LUAm3]|nr:hypothetical protein NEFER03_1767 [Nematocida sp. LUAm3]KAI5173926.1 hypothetical protein NEFER02_0393 [Nematocida sp. LUAm2]KAI5177329.1 hypothetical protein NEFER01_0604 [Nematocida sp. LUAm1]